MKLLYSLIIFLFLLFPVINYGQGNKGLILEGVVSLDQSGVNRAAIEVYRNNRQLDNLKLGNRGNFRIELEYDHEYTLIFTQPGYFPQKITVDTSIPAEVLRENSNFLVSPVNIMLFTEVQETDRSFFDKPVMKIYYSSSAENYISDLYYSSSQIRQVIQRVVNPIQQSGEDDKHGNIVPDKTTIALKKEYDLHIRQAEVEYNNEDFVAALDGYKAAADIFPDEKYPLDRIAEINDLLGLLMVKEEMDKAVKERMANLLNQGNVLFEQKNYEQAKALYQRVLSIDPKNKQASERLYEIQDIDQKNQTEKQYALLIQAANNSFDDLLYAEAKKLYEQALELNADDEHPRQRLQRIEEILQQQASNAEKIKGYKESVFQAELHYDKQFYDKALAYYENALVHKPGDALAEGKIDEIKELMNQLAVRSLYEKKIKTADRAFQRKEFTKALAEYTAASEMLPEEEHPNQRIQEIKTHIDNQDRLAAEAKAEEERLAAEAAEKALAEQQAAALEVRYKQSIFIADSLFNVEEYENALSSFEAASLVKPSEVYPQERIVEISRLLEQHAARQEIYKAAVARGDAAYEGERFDAAVNAYAEALKANPKAAYPATMLERVDSVLMARAEAEQIRMAAEAAEKALLETQAAERENKYNRAISEADSLYKIEDYTASLAYYKAAMQIKPEEIYLQQRIDEIIKLTEEVAIRRQKYSEAIAKGDAAFAAEHFEDAVNAYADAAKLHPDESYPGEMLVRVDSLVVVRRHQFAQAAAEQARLEAEAAEQARIDALAAEKEIKYKQAVSAADSLYELQSFELSKAGYEKALGFYQFAEYPQQRIVEIDRIIAQEAEKQQQADLEQQFQQAIQRANLYFEREEYGQAITQYNAALTVRPDDQYARLRIDEAGQLLQQQVQENQYAEIILKADGLFFVNDWEKAKAEYQNAMTMKPDDPYSAEQIDSINYLLEQMEEQQLAEQLAAAEEEHQKKALEEQALLEKARLELNDAGLEKIYREYLTTADGFFDQQRYNVARAWYYKALDVRQDDPYPKEQIGEINRIVNASAFNHIDREYQTLINNADSAFRANQLAVARGWYNRALSMKAAESYPREQLREIERIIAERMAGKSEERFNEIMQQAHASYESGHVNVARYWLKKALELRPDHAGAKEQLQSIEGG